MEAQVRYYDTVIDRLQHEGPGLADFVTADELNALLDGRLAHGEIADRYYAAVKADESNNLYLIGSSDQQIRADLLDWIAIELVPNAQWRAEDAREAALEEIRVHVAEEAREITRMRVERMRLVRRALELDAEKQQVAEAARVSRPTLDKWLK